MADENTTPPDTDQNPDPPEELGDAGKRALAEERKARREAEKQLKGLSEQLKALQDRDKTESERLAERAAAAEKEAEQAKATALRLEVAADKGLTPTQAKRLMGATREELEADADELLSTFATDPRPGDNLRERPRPPRGHIGSTEGDESAKARAAAAMRQFRSTT